jgi:hypothetical protein
VSPRGRIVGWGLRAGLGVAFFCLRCVHHAPEELGPPGKEETVYAYEPLRANVRCTTPILCARCGKRLPIVEMRS